MRESYDDIRSRIAESPVWYDQNGAPRYGTFTYKGCPNVYAVEIVLLRIACQACGQQFDVEMSGDIFSRLGNPKELHYGDPPIHECVGDTMNCDDLAVLEVWYRSGTGDWERHSKLEGMIDAEMLP